MVEGEECWAQYSIQNIFSFPQPNRFSLLDTKRAANNPVMGCTSPQVLNYFSLL